MPILALGTCKTEQVGQCVQLIKTILDAWRLSPDGEVRHGPIWSFALDGDGVRQAAFHNIFMMDTLGPMTLSMDFLALFVASINKLVSIILLWNSIQSICLSVSD